MLQIHKKELGNLIYNRLNGVIPRTVIYDVIYIICDDLSEKLKNNKSIVIDHFGMLDVSVFSGHEGIDKQTGEVTVLNSFKRISFIPSKTFSDFLSHVRYKFKKRKK